MIVTLLGYENKTYTKKDTGEVKECLELYYSKANKVQNAVGCTVGSEFVTANAFPEQFKAIIKAGASIIGKKLSISKDVRTIGGKTYASLDELEILE